MAQVSTARASSLASAWPSGASQQPVSGGGLSREQLNQQYTDAYNKANNARLGLPAGSPSIGLLRMAPAGWTPGMPVGGGSSQQPAYGANGTFGYAVQEKFGGGSSQSPASGVVNNLLLRTRPPGYAAPPAGGYGSGAPQQLGAPSTQATPYQYNYNMTPTASGRIVSMPYGQANSQTWNNIGGMVGLNSDQMASTLGALPQNMLPSIAAYAQQHLGTPVPGDGQGVNVNAFAAPRPTTLNTPSPNQSTSSYAGTVNAMRQKLGSMIPAGFRFQ